MSPLKHFKFLIALSLFLGLSPTHAQVMSFEQQCLTRLPSPSVVVDWSQSAIEYDNSRSVRDLTQTQATVRPLSKNETVLGLTLTKFNYSINWNHTRLEGPHQDCFSPAIKISLSVSPQKVYVGKEFTYGSCAFNEIVRHELTHVTANQRQVQWLGAYLQDQLSAQLQKTPYMGSYAKWQQTFNSYLKTQLMPAISNLFDEVNQVHNKIDAPEEYAKNEFVCNGDIPRILKAAGVMF